MVIGEKMTTPNTSKDAGELAAELVERFSDHVDLSEDELAQKIDKLASEFKMPLDEAQRSVKNNLMSEYDIEEDDVGEGGEPNSHVLVGEINQDEQWVDVTVKVDQLWEPNSDSIAQVGLVGDESGKIKFVSFETSDLPEIKEGQSYELTNVVTDEYDGDYSIKLNRTTGINPIDDDVEIGENKETMTGAIVDLQGGSGLIERCPEDGCTRVLRNGRCTEHGEVDGVDDLRIKAVLDTGVSVQKVIFNAEATEEITGISLDKAVEMAREEMDRDVVERKIRKMVVGKYYEITGPMLGDNLLANEFEESPQTDNAEAVLTKARSI